MQLGDHPDLALLTGAQMRAAEQAAFARGLPSFEAMRRAGVAVADAIMRALAGRRRRRRPCAVRARQQWRRWLRHRRHAARRGLSRDAPRRSGQVRVWRRCRARRGDVAGDAPKPDADAIAALDRSAIVVDALFGIGLDRALEGETAALIEAVNRAAATVVAVDIASGVHADDGRIMGAAIAADLTVTFGWRKLGHVLQPGAEQCGEVVVADVGFNADDLAAANPACRLNRRRCGLRPIRSRSRRITNTSAAMR